MYCWNNQRVWAVEKRVLHKNSRQRKTDVSKSYLLTCLRSLAAFLVSECPHCLRSLQWSPRASVAAPFLLLLLCAVCSHLLLFQAWMLGFGSWLWAHRLLQQWASPQGWGQGYSSPELTFSVWWPAPLTSFRVSGTLFPKKHACGL